MKKNIIFTVFSIILLLCLIANVYRVANGSTAYVSFSGLVSYLQDVPKLLVYNIPEQKWLSGDWLILNPLKDLLNVLADVLRAGLYTSTNLINLVGYLFYFIVYLFA